LKNTTLQQQIAATLLPNIGPKRMRTILSHTESLEHFFEMKKKEFLKISGLGEILVKNLNREKALQAAENYLSFYENSEIETHFFQDSTYPKRLNECVDAPLLLFSKGNMDLKTHKTVAIVGTRNASEYGKRICEDLIQSFVGKNILVVSGLAYGIDIYVHQLCVKYNIQTVGVLAHGLDRLYPSLHKKTAEHMLLNGGLVTEFLQGTNPDRENFPMRNRIVAGLCDATIVIESGLKGGSLITADLANDYDREVFAYPGSIFSDYSKGCNFLIQKNKANLISKPQDFLDFMAWSDAKTTKKEQLDLFANLNEDEKQLVQCFENKKELTFDHLIYTSKLSFSKLSSTLLNLEFSGLIKSFPGKCYQIQF
jgi:DNA processing protein